MPGAGVPDLKSGEIPFGFDQGILQLVALTHASLAMMLGAIGAASHPIMEQSHAELAATEQVVASDGDTQKTRRGSPAGHTF